MRRPYPNISSVHRDKKAQTFIKAMWGACLEAGKLNNLHQNNTKATSRTI
jgi:hypothetical protein